MVASEVSDLYQGSRELAENIAKLKEFQAYIRSTIKNVAVITRENEILSLKMRIHDELGGSLLKLRRYHLHTDGRIQVGAAGQLEEDRIHAEIQKWTG